MKKNTTKPTTTSPAPATKPLAAAPAARKKTTSASPRKKAAPVAAPAALPPMAAPAPAPAPLPPPIAASGAVKPVPAPAPVAVKPAVAPAPTPPKSVVAAPQPAPVAVQPVGQRPVVTTISARIDIGFGNHLTIRGEGPGLSWDAGVPMNCLADDLWQIKLGESTRGYVFKVLVNDLTWSTGPDFTIASGASVTITPQF